MSLGFGVLLRSLGDISAIEVQGTLRLYPPEDQMESAVILRPN
jgi:hypothetical protein